MNEFGSSFAIEKEPPFFSLEMPLFGAYSPADLLDRHLERSGDVHAKQVCNLPLPAKGAVSWTHFGGDLLWNSISEPLAILVTHCELHCRDATS